MTAVRLGVAILPELAWASSGATAWGRAEAIGFAHAWTYDHLAWRELRDDPWYSATTTLAAAAVTTSTIGLGTLVASPNFRHPVPFARDLLSLDDLSGGRLTAGIGAGGHGWDATLLGQDELSARQRADRFAEFVGLTDQLLRHPVTDHSGPWYAAVDAPMAPGCVQQPRVPFAIAATGPRGMALAATFGQVWVTTGDPRNDGAPLGAAEGARSLRPQLDALERACEAADRDPATIDRLVLTGLELDDGLGSIDELRHTLGCYGEASFTDLVVHRPRPSAPYAGDVERFEAICAEVLRSA